MLNKDTQLCISLSGRPSNIGTRFHNYLYQKLDLDFIYKAFSTTDIEHAVKGVKALGIRGCSVSMPFKETCIPFIDTLSDSVLAIDSVNTIVNDKGHLTAYNTDYIAVKNLIQDNFNDTQMSVFVKGSGGMAKAVVAAFRDSGFTRVTIVARNQQQGQALAEKYGYQWRQDTAGQQADILVNVTPIGMSGGVEENSLAFEKEAVSTARWVFDVVAFPSETPLIRLAKQLGKPVVTGAEVIALQALEQFALYTGVRPDEQLMREASAFSRL
ncbi:shikimate 5-dehydrogenase [Enterobacter sp. Tr-810]|uniref:shikimate 5-dehydrogenase n=1 Tax=Enterobacter sp. Tr-810 TaxID=2608347 RepID=UPI0014197BD9|nr:shikimate 5-dehydrogenase [Enterobacter sp. Tr-810]NIF38612.1 shikimate 5-dehydrogenase [Enterobacter sp. Tr-810]